MLMQLVSVCTLSQRHLERVTLLCMCTHLPCGPEILGLLLIATLHVFSGPFSGISQHPAARNLVKYHAEREGRQNGSVKLSPSCMCWVYSCLRPCAMQAVRCFNETSRLGLANGPPSG